MYKKESNNKSVSNNTKRLIISSAILLVVVLGITYAWLSITIFAENTNTVVAGTLSLKLDEHEYIDIAGEDAIPISKEIALEKKNNVYSFEIENNGNVDSEYTIYLDVLNETDDEIIPNNLIRYMFTKNEISSQDKLLSEAPMESLEGENKGKIVLDSSNFDSSSQALKPGNKNTYSLRLWIDSNATTDIAGKVFSAKIKIVATQTDIE